MSGGRLGHSPSFEEADDVEPDELMRMVQQLNDNLSGSFDEMFKVPSSAAFCAGFQPSTALRLQGLESTLAALDGSLGGMESNFDGEAQPLRTTSEMQQLAKLGAVLRNQMWRTLATTTHSRRQQVSEVRLRSFCLAHSRRADQVVFVHRSDATDALGGILRRHVAAAPAYPPRFFPLSRNPRAMPRDRPPF